jgi:Glycosyl transferase family 11
MNIIVRQNSGLGNQLFQYAAGRYLAKRYDASLQVSEELDHKLVSFGHPRPVLLRKFAVRAEVRAASYFDRLVLSTRRRFQLLAKLARAACNIQVIRQNPERFLFHQELQIAAGVRTAYLAGFWQDSEIVQKIEPELRREFSLIDPLCGKDLEVAQRIAAAEHAISLHFRRGDYASFFGREMLLSREYYERAMGHFVKQNPRSTFFVFSDDFKFAHEWSRGDPRIVIVDHNDATRGHEDMRLMSLCRHHIIANSTFSWWGAWLNSRSDKQIVAPATWLGFDTRTIAMASPSWILVDN